MSGTDLLRWPLLGRFLRWHYARAAMQIPLFLLAAVMIVHGFLGPQLAPRNLSTLFTWVHYRGALVLVLLAAGNLFCMACPFMLPRAIARRFFKPVRRWPKRLRSKWLSAGLFVLVLFAYELFDLWGSPAWTAALILGYFAGALAVDSLFEKASFCKWVCPVGQFNFVASTLSPLEVQVREPDVCARCTTHDCIKGNDRDDRNRVPGCELNLFLPRKTGNMDCTFCLDCVHACPHDNVAISTRLPGSELWSDAPRSGIGFFSKRKDLAALALVFTFGALLNAFGMVSPVYAVQSWLAERMGTTQEAPILGILFFLLLVVEPVLLMGLAAWLTRRAAGTPGRHQPLLPIATRFAYALVPIGFGVWLAHYSFHLLTGLWTFVPVVQKMLGAAPDWTWGGLSEQAVTPLEMGFLGLGLLGSLLVSFRIAEREYPARAARAFLPWAGLSVLLWGTAMWLLSQPMEMRGTFLGG